MVKVTFLHVVLLGLDALFLEFPLERRPLFVEGRSEVVVDAAEDVLAEEARQVDGHRVRHGAGRGQGLST